MPRLSKLGAAALAAFGWTSGVSAVTATYLVVAGGGGGSSNGGYSGGGGGAGGFRTGTLSLTPTLSYTVTVGAGGAGGTSTISNGSDSVFSTITSIGGGAASSAIAPPGSAGSAGGSGGGGSFGQGGGAGTSGQGNAGGSSVNIANVGAWAGGGGGAGAVGSNGANGTPGNGGNGLASSISGTSVTYAGGGGSSQQYSVFNGTGGTGGGGAGVYNGTGVSGTANTGGGAGAGNIGGRGGSGVVIISYAGAQQFSGGVVTSVGGNTIHTFNTSGTLGPITPLSANYLVVAGGAGGGGSSYGGGGGAGGLLSGSGLTIDPSSTYLVTVGAGGAGGAGGAFGVNGSNSVFLSITSTGGGGGSFGDGAGGTRTGNSGGSGGGGGSFGSSSTGTGGTGTSGQGNNGGNGGTDGATYRSGGGGGGAGAVGANISSGAGGNGGAGTASSISGSSVTYAGGGGGAGNSSNGTGGSGGGGSAPSVAGTANLGGGGGGAGASGSGGAGGSGVVIISYAGSTQQMAGGTVTITGGNVIHTFTSSGYLTPIKYVGNSLRFRSSASAYLNRTFGTPTNNKIWTYSFWYKRGTMGDGGTAGINKSPLFDAPSSASTFDTIYIRNADNFIWYEASGGATVCYLETTQVFRDPAAWYHFVIVYDSAQATAADRQKIYVNGVQITAFSTAIYVAQNTNGRINSAVAHKIGSSDAAGTYLDGYITEANFIDGQALTPNSFGTRNSYGVWQPITYGGSYGTNGFYLPMTPSTSTYAGLLSNSDYLTAPSNAAFAVGTSDFTMETWFYPTSASQTGQFFLVAPNGIQMGYQSAGAWGLAHANVAWQITTGTLPTTNAWNHMAITRSGTTVGLFLNGVRLTTGTISTNYSQNTCVIGQGIIGYMSNSRFVKGTAVYNPSNPTYTVPTAPLTNITNTSLLTFQNSTNIDNSSNGFTLTPTGTVRDLIAYPFNLSTVPDYSPNGNNWTANNIQPVAGVNMDVMTDVPTLTSATAANYCVLNPLWVGSGITASNANLTATASSSANSLALGTIAVSSGKWYWESTIVSGSSMWAGGVVNPAISTPNYTSLTTNNSYAWNNASTSYNGQTGTTYGATYTTNDVIGTALDLDAGTITFYKNGTSQGVAYTSISGTFTPMVLLNTSSISINFGQRPFTYTPPSGFVALNTFNL